MSTSRAQAVRILVIVVAMAGFSYWLHLRQLTETYRGEAARQGSLAAFRTMEGGRLEAAAKTSDDPEELRRQAARSARQADYHRALEQKYGEAAKHPWRTLEPDPEPPE